MNVGYRYTYEKNSDRMDPVLGQSNRQNEKSLLFLVVFRLLLAAIRMPVTCIR